MNLEPARQRGHAHALRAGCSHSVHFGVREACSRSFLWFRRRPDQRVIGPVLGLGILADALIPRGNKPLNPLSSVPAAFHCAHPNVVVQTNDISSLTPRFPDLALPLGGGALHVEVEQDGEGLTGPT
ncbi:hypothetical protein [Microbacterium sp.]|uniref:hypothetical protein n=1 Tax=Microbacterium sp. TaxID=51671 RepID=UPI0039E52AC0